MVGDPRGEAGSNGSFAAGAVGGRLIKYTDAAAFIRDLGDKVDQIGDESSALLNIQEHGEPASFEERSLPADFARREYHEYTLTDSLPTGWTIEVGKTAPEFGRPGGAWQMQVVDDGGGSVAIKDLLGGVLQ